MIPISIAPASGALPFLGLLLSILTWVVVKWPIRRKSSTSQIQQPEKESFTKPLPSPHPNDPTSHNPKLYRPFRHGPNFITMGIRKLHWDNWIEMDSYFLRYHDMKAAELKKDFKEHIKYVDNAVTKDACFELNEELVRHLTHRYPKTFRLEGGKMHNSLTGEAFPFPAGMLRFILSLLQKGFRLTLTIATPDEALATSALLVQDDLVLMMKNDGTFSSLGNSKCAVSHAIQMENTTLTQPLSVFPASGV